MTRSKANSRGECDAPRDSVSWFPRDERVFAVTLVLALGFHLALAPLGQADETTRIARSVPPELAVEIVPLPPPPPPPAPVVEEPEAKPESKPQPSPLPQSTHLAEAAAEASKALVAEPEADDEETDDTIVEGEAEAFAGGVTDEQGTSKEAVTDVGAKGAADTQLAAPVASAHATDHSRGAHCSLDVDWKCEFPDDGHFDMAVVFARMHLRSNGSVDHVEIMSSPSAPYAREATRCGLRQKCFAARDPDGHDVPGATNPIKIRFIR